jgi:hypothetical protein
LARPNSAISTEAARSLIVSSAGEKLLFQPSIVPANKPLLFSIGVKLFRAVTA